MLFILLAVSSCTLTEILKSPNQGWNEWLLSLLISVSKISWTNSLIDENARYSLSANCLSVKLFSHNLS